MQSPTGVDVRPALRVQVSAVPAVPVPVDSSTQSTSLLPTTALLVTMTPLLSAAPGCRVPGLVPLRVEFCTMLLRTVTLRWLSLMEIPVVRSRMMFDSISRLVLAARRRSAALAEIPVPMSPERMLRVDRQAVGVADDVDDRPVVRGRGLRRLVALDDAPRSRC